MTLSGYLNTNIPSNELCAQELENAEKVTAEIIERKNGSRYLNLTVDYGSGNSLVKMQGLNDKAKEEDERFLKIAAPYIR